MEQKRKRIQAMVKIAAVFGIVLFAAPVVAIAIKSLVELLVFIVITVVAVNAAPWFGAMVANWRLKALKFECGTQPHRDAGKSGIGQDAGLGCQWPKHQRPSGGGARLVVANSGSRYAISRKAFAES